MHFQHVCHPVEYFSLDCQIRTQQSSYKSAYEVIWAQDFAETGCIDLLTAKENHHWFPDLSNWAYKYTKRLIRMERGTQRRQIRHSVNIRWIEMRGRAKGQRLPADRQLCVQSATVKPNTHDHFANFPFNNLSTCPPQWRCTTQVLDVLWQDTDGICCLHWHDRLI